MLAIELGIPDLGQGAAFFNKGGPIPGESGFALLKLALFLVG